VGEGKNLLKRMKNIETTQLSIYLYEYNIMYCTVSCWTSREHGHRENASNRRVDLIKAPYTQA
jgi:hypothetical protein